jgi:hypothetical protein
MPLPKLIPNSFSTYELTEEEESNGSIFTEDQLRVLQNKLAEVAEEKIALEFDPSEPLLFQQQEAYKRGQLDMLRYLLDMSASCVQARIEEYTQETH